MGSIKADSTAAHDAWQTNLNTISAGTWNVCEAALRHAPECRVFVTGSGLQFENTGGPIDERTPFRASSPYAVERIHATHTARYYRTKGLRTYVGYLFHHDSPLRGERHLSRCRSSARTSSKAVAPSRVLSHSKSTSSAL